MSTSMRLPLWIKYGLALGLVFFLAVFIIKPVGVSTQFSVLSGIIHRVIDPNVISENQNSKTGYTSTNAYYAKDDGKLAQNIANPLKYDFLFVLAIPLGAYLGYLVKRKNKVTNDVLKSNNLIKNQRGFLKTYLPSFISGVLLLYGARMAGGCTSGHMMSGIMQGSVSGFIFAFAVFIIAIPVALFAGKLFRNGGAI